MAGGGAGALLLRAAALGGLTAAAWLLGGTDASASPEEPPAVEITTEAAQGASQLLEDPAGWAKALTAAGIGKGSPAPKWMTDGVPYLVKQAANGGN